jgi:RNA polymerase sigma factor (TIGR02999 family)
VAGPRHFGPAIESSESLDELMPLVYAELRRIAHAQLSRDRGSTLATTGLVHEVYLRLAGSRLAASIDRVHVLALAAVAMRQVIVDRAKARRALKRGGAGYRVTLDEEAIAAEDQSEAVLEIHDALDRLASIDERLARVVVLRFFGGLPPEAIAEVNGVTVRTVERDWAKARMLLRELLAQ